MYATETLHALTFSFSNFIMIVVFRWWFWWLTATPTSTPVEQFRPPNLSSPSARPCTASPMAKERSWASWRRSQARPTANTFFNLTVISAPSPRRCLTDSAVLKTRRPRFVIFDRYCSLAYPEGVLPPPIASSLFFEVCAIKNTTWYHWNRWIAINMDVKFDVKFDACIWTKTNDFQYFCNFLPGPFSDHIFMRLIFYTSTYH